jgi:hypothetical protein
MVGPPDEDPLLLELLLDEEVLPDELLLDDACLPDDELLLEELLGLMCPPELLVLPLEGSPEQASRPPTNSEAISVWQILEVIFIVWLRGFFIYYGAMVKPSAMKNCVEM